MGDADPVCPYEDELDKAMVAFLKVMKGCDQRHRLYGADTVMALTSFFQAHYASSGQIPDNILDAMIGDLSE